MNHKTEPWGDAVVIGGSLAGLLAAAVLAASFERVTVVERGSLALGPDAHSDIPQASHTHVLLMRGRQALEQLLPGLEAEVVAAGAPRSDGAADGRTFGRHGWLPRWHSGLTTFAASRHLLDGTVRRRVLQMPNVVARGGTEAIGIVVQNGAVTGVRVRERVRDAEETTLRADLVIDAGGRTSRMPDWLAAAGFGRPRETVIDAQVGYATRWYRKPAGLDFGWKQMTIQSLSPTVPRAGVVVEMENGTMAVTLMGATGDYPPTDPDAFVEFAATLRDPALHDAVIQLEPLTPVYGYRRTENRLLHYERMPYFPEHLLVLGDAACGFNPTYGQGMTVAALGAELLQTLLGEQRGRFPDGELRQLGRRFQRQLAQLSQPAWSLATGEDSRYPTTRGARHSFMDRLIDPYMGRLVATLMVDREVAQTFLEVIHMVKSPTVLFAPRFVRYVLEHSRDLDMPTVAEEIRRPQAPSTMQGAA